MSRDVTLGTNFLEMSPCARAYVSITYEKKQHQQQNKTKTKQNKGKRFKAKHKERPEIGKQNV